MKIKKVSELDAFVGQELLIPATVCGVDPDTKHPIAVKYPDGSIEWLHENVQVSETTKGAEVAESGSIWNCAVYVFNPAYKEEILLYQTTQIESTLEAKRFVDSFNSEPMRYMFSDGFQMFFAACGREPIERVKEKARHQLESKVRAIQTFLHNTMRELRN